MSKIVCGSSHQEGDSISASLDYALALTKVSSGVSPRAEHPGVLAAAAVVPPGGARRRHLRHAPSPLTLAGGNDYRHLSS